MPDSPIAGWLYLAAIAAVGIGTIVCRIIERASEDIRIKLTLLIVMGPVPLLLAVSTYFPNLGLTTLKIGIGYTITFGVAAAIVGIVHLTRRVHKT